MPSENPLLPSGTDADLPAAHSRRTFITASAVGGAVAVAGPSLLGAGPADTADALNSRVSLTAGGSTGASRPSTWDLTIPEP